MLAETYIGNWKPVNQLWCPLNQIETPAVHSRLHSQLQSTTVNYSLLRDWFKYEELYVIQRQTKVVIVRHLPSQKIIYKPNKIIIQCDS